MRDRGNKRDVERKKLLFRIRKSVYGNEDPLSKGNYNLDDVQ